MSVSHKHTKGPWVVESVNGPYPHDICLGYDILGEGSPILLATVFSDEEDANDGPISVLEANANARLISASPDLLDACQAALIEFRHLGQALGEMLPRETVEVWGRVEAAIGKAEGKG